MTKSLGGIAELLAADGDFLGEHAEVVGEGEHVLEHGDSLVEVFGVVEAGAGEGFDEPEGAHAEGAFAAADSWGVVSGGSDVWGGEEGWKGGFVTYHHQSFDCRSGTPCQRW